MIMNATQPSSDSPAKPYCSLSATAAHDGQNFTASRTSECDAR